MSEDKEIKFQTNNSSSPIDLTDEIKPKLDKLIKMKGLGEKTAKLFVDNIDKFKVFLVKAKLLYKLEEYTKAQNKAVKVEGPLSGKTVVMTGFRDKELI